MPEGVEVCLTALWLNSMLKGKLLIDIKIISGRYSRHTMKGLSQFIKDKPYVINSVNSKGKFMFFELIDKNNKDYYILNRYGLEGSWGFVEYKHSGVEFKIQDKQTNVITYLYFTDARSFGTIEITNNKKDLIFELDKLAPDVLKTPFTDNQFHKAISNYVTNKNGNVIDSRADKEIIKILMDQTILVSGLGNYLTVESLFRAKISPHKKLIEFYKDKKLSNKLSKSIKYTVKLVYLTADIGYLEDLEPEMMNFIKKLRNDVNNNELHSFNFHPTVKIKKNDVFTFKVYRQKTDPHGNDIETDKIISGRTTYWSPSIQK